MNWIRQRENRMPVILGISLWWLVGAIGAAGVIIIGWFPIKNKKK